jgi:hypothetical protein
MSEQEKKELLEALRDALSWLKDEGFGRTPEYERLKAILDKARIS